MITLVIEDRCGAQPARAVHRLHWREGVLCSARELIRERVSLEFKALKHPRGPRALDSHLVQYPRTMDCQLREAVSLALRGFELESYFLVVDGRHIRDVDQKFPLTALSRVTYQRLLPKMAA
ncbi:MAG: hypothetical protein AAGF81_17350 [Pseudomonadota bacterium]